MEITFKGVYEDGVIKPDEPLDLRDRERVDVTVNPASGKMPKTGTRNLLDLVGVGRDIWAQMDADEYIRQERASWDRFPTD